MSRQGEGAPEKGERCGHKAEKWFREGTKHKRSGQASRVTSFYLSNLPNSLTRKELWFECCNLGRIVDACIPNKRDNSKSKFRFVRFANVREIGKLDKALNNLLIGSLKVSANVVKFDKSGNRVRAKFSSGRYNLNNPKPIPQKPPNASNHAGTSRTFGDVSFNEALENNNSCSSLKFNNASKLAAGWKNLSLIGEVTDMNVLCDLKNLLNGLVHFGTKLRYLWGMKVMLTFGSSVGARKFLHDKKEEHERLFKNLQFWEGQVIPFESTFDWIGQLFGKVVEGSDVSSGTGIIQMLGPGFIINPVRSSSPVVSINGASPEKGDSSLNNSEDEASHTRGKMGGNSGIASHGHSKSGDNNNDNYEGKIPCAVVNSKEGN
ncbi:hypothetical protein L1987_18213 [Smallanthus sonchifolius]|uniref:Uncharacterized protein n=1 Tax=Smallanthus sonchifolius TaxID=185202 RepID=A0ACB9IZ45_9ASTR|nr:hypothetical protein L1987_18213 [Smallanthus sonchifolius]